MMAIMTLINKIKIIQNNGLMLSLLIFTTMTLISISYWLWTPLCTIPKCHTNVFMVKYIFPIICILSAHNIFKYFIMQNPKNDEKPKKNDDDDNEKKGWKCNNPRKI